MKDDLNNKLIELKQLRETGKLKFKLETELN